MFCLLGLAACNRTPALPLKQMFEVPAFTLTERSGQPFDSATMKGKVWVVSFFFATCHGTCPLLNSRMEALQKATADLPGVSLLSVSTDEEDTPERLREYATGQHAGDRWFFVTGKKDPVFRLGNEGFKIGLVEPDAVNAKEKFIHGTKIALVDQQGWIRGYYDGVGDTAEADSARLVADIKRLLATP